MNKELFFYNVNGFPNRHFIICLDKNFAIKAKNKKPNKEYLQNLEKRLDVIKKLWEDNPVQKKDLFFSFYKGCLLNSLSVAPTSVDMGAPIIKDQLKDKNRNNLFYSTHNIYEDRQAYALLSMFIIWADETKDFLYRKI